MGSSLPEPFTQSLSSQTPPSPFYREIFRILQNHKLLSKTDGNRVDIEKLLEMIQRGLDVMEEGEEEREVRSILVEELARDITNTSDEFIQVLERLEKRCVSGGNTMIVFHREVDVMYNTNELHQMSPVVEGSDTVTEFVSKLIYKFEKTLVKLSDASIAAFLMRLKIIRRYHDAKYDTIQTSRFDRQDTIYSWDTASSTFSAISKDYKTVLAALRELSKKNDTELKKVEEWLSESVIDLLLEWKEGMEGKVDVGMVM